MSASSSDSSSSSTSSDSASLHSVSADEFYAAPRAGIKSVAWGGHMRLPENFDSERWYTEARRQSRKMAESKESRRHLVALRTYVQETTLQACEDGFYTIRTANGTARRVLLHKGSRSKHEFASRSKMFNYAKQSLPKIPSKITRARKGTRKPHSTIVRVVENDCVQEALEMLAAGRNPVVLNNANAEVPGGYYRNGAPAQEESIFRRSTYAVALDDDMFHVSGRSWKYPIGNHGAIYSPGVLIFRETEMNGYAFFTEPHELSFIACAAVRKPELTQNETRLQRSDASLMRTKIRTICQVALDSGHDSMVLGAFGCGVYRNPPEHVAMLFREVLEEYEGCFREVVFAILGSELVSVFSETLLRPGKRSGSKRRKSSKSSSKKDSS